MLYCLCLCMKCTRNLQCNVIICRIITIVTGSVNTSTDYDITWFEYNWTPLSYHDLYHYLIKSPSIRGFRKEYMGSSFGPPNMGRGTHYEREA